jgi:steroid delta-isomerase-like uncharacterized protein
MSDLRSLVHDIYSLLSKHDLDGFLDLVADDMIEHEELPFPEANGGKAGVGALFQSLFAAFPDFEMVVEDTIVEDDKAVIRVRAQGTHHGEFMGIPATGRRIEVPLIDIMRIRDGKIAEHWGVMDNAAMMQQLGMAPG